jgi:branched-chain amino acid transport system permease protein
VWLLITLMFAVSMLASGGLGVAIERFAYRPLRNAPRIAPLISALGVSFFLQNSALLLFGSNFRTYDTFSLINPVSGIHEGPLNISIPRILTMMGIDVDRVIVVTFFIGSALAGAAGVMFGLVFGQIFHLMGFFAGLKGFTAAVIGGIGSIPGAMAGGLILGFAEAYTQGYISTKWSDLLVFVILIGFMLFRPQGLFGKADIRKV